MLTEASRRRGRVAAFAFCLVASACTSNPTHSVPVPAKYRQLYRHLQASLDAYDSAVEAMPRTRHRAHRRVAATELLPANGNRLEALLGPTTLPSVDAWLDRLHAMGIRGVTIGVKVPMLLPQFGPHSAAYTDFFATVARRARAKGMTVDVELGALFCGTAYATCTSPFDGSFDQFVKLTVAQARIVVDRVRPDYLNLLSEPTTEASLTGVREFATPDGAARYVHEVIAGIGAHGRTKLGAGAATWLPTSFNAAILEQPIDFLAMHIYPINPQIADNIVKNTALARRAHIPIVADEVGLYKTDTANQAGAATADSVYRRDSFSFFEPLDVRFLAITAKWAKKAGVAYVSPFWAGQFFAYLTWTPALDAAPFPVLTRASNQAVSRAFQAGDLTTYGRSWPDAFARGHRRV